MQYILKHRPCHALKSFYFKALQSEQAALRKRDTGFAAARRMKIHSAQSTRARCQALFFNPPPRPFGGARNIKRTQTCNATAEN